MHGQVGICRRASAYESNNIMRMMKRMKEEGHVIVAQIHARYFGVHGRVCMAARSHEHPDRDVPVNEKPIIPQLS